ncbi:hypothetical protein ALC62_13469 [Cyphomyrmex costatus]|uniref:Uncharacterized protein n=1 Tax=Cyphomyrmex costatus TaxID=456900 RepID=A0A151I9Y4_9HYME|nr:hypothetical protein ALC62_13469 [Cyphomyrmex costatus]
MNSENLFIIICELLNSLKQSVCVFKKQKLRRKIVKLYVLYKIAERNENNKKRKYWVRPIFSIERRSQQGASENLVKEMQIGNTEKYVDYFRMSPQLFEALLQLVGPILTKEYVVREPISCVTRLQITLRYLAGDRV